jgi:hypothetical protein
LPETLKGMINVILLALVSECGISTSVSGKPEPDILGELSLQGLPRFVITQNNRTAKNF